MSEPINVSTPSHPVKEWEDGNDGYMRPEQPVFGTIECRVPDDAVPHFARASKLHRRTKTLDPQVRGSSPRVHTTETAGRWPIRREAVIKLLARTR